MRHLWCVVVALIVSCLFEPRARAEPPPPLSAPAPVLVAPEPIRSPKAAYPPAALAAGKESSVTVLATVGVDGVVKGVEIAESGGELFDQAAMVAALQWRFKPALRDGKPIESQFRIPFHFHGVVHEAPPPTTTTAPAAPAVTTPPPVLPPTTPEAPAVAAPAATTAAGTGALLDPKAPSFESTVAGKRPAAPSRGASDYHVDVGALNTVPRKDASDFLKLAPGVLLTNEGSEAHADQVFLRGFDAREGQDVEFTVDGVPINESGNLHGNGYADTHFIIPELVSALRVIEGPFDPRQGNYAVAGGADYQLGLADRGITAKLTIGSFNTVRTLLLWGPAGTGEGTFAAVELYQTDGFGQNRDGRRGTVMAQYEGHKGPHRYRITGSAYLASFHSAGVIRQDDYNAGRIGFFGSYDPRQGADTSRYQLSAALESRAGALTVSNMVWASIRPFRLRENFTGFTLDPQEPQQPLHGQRGDLIDLSSLAVTVGARGSARWVARLFGQPQEIEVGYFARGDFVNATQQRVADGSNAPYHVDTDMDARLGDIGLYADLNLRPFSWLTLRGGLRADLFTYDFHDRCAVQSVAHPSRTDPPGDKSCLSQQDRGIYREPDQRATTVGVAWLPRFSLLVGPFAGFGASVSYGRGVRSIDPVYISQDARTPFASAESLETGLTFARRIAGLDVGVRSVLFRNRVDHDLVFSEVAGRNILGGATTRLGNASALRVTGSYLDVSASATYVRATFDDTGRLISYVPDLVVRFDTSLFGEIPKLRPWSKPIKASVSTGVSYVAPRPLPQGERGNPIFTVDVNATVSWWILELGFSCTNLLDSRYRLGEYNFVSDFRRPGEGGSAASSLPTLVPERHFSAGPPRSVFFTLGFRFGGGK